MEFTIERSELLSGLYLTQGIVERRTTIPILSNVLIQSAADGIAIVATDQEVTVQRLCKAALKQKGKLTTSARKLYEMVREFPEGEVKFRSLDSGWIEISTARARFRLVGLDPQEFPLPSASAEAAAGKPLHLPSTVLSEMIERTVFAMSADETRTNLHGIYVETVGPGLLRLVATDGHRLALVTRAAEGDALGKGVVLPRKAVQELRKVLEGAEEDAVDLSVCGGTAHVRRGPVEMSMRLVEGEFPDYRQVMPAKTDRTAVMGLGDFLAALKRISVVSSERNRGVKLQLEERRLEISSINPDVGEGVEEMEVEYEGDGLSIGFNARYMIEALSLLSPDERLEIALSDDVSPCVLRCPSDPDYCYIVMPMRL
jgi:DNA polymerase-3 subunit beta